MNTDFPEYIFDANGVRMPLYRHLVDLGKQISKTKKIIFCGICRNVGQHLDLNIQRIFRTAKKFKEFHTFIYENDSTDNTVDILKHYKSDNFSFISTTRSDQDYKKDLDNGIDPWHFNRCKILAECRNEYVKYVLNNFTHYDYLCIVDLDLKGGWSYDGINHGIATLESHDKYAAVTSYGVLADPLGHMMLEERPAKDYVMYDSFAFRPENFNRGLHILRTPTFNNITFKRGQDPVKVTSNFGGLAIYKLPLFKDKTYSVKQWKSGEIDPEHVHVHRSLINDGYDIILDPSMIVSYADHQFSKNLIEHSININT